MSVFNEALGELEKARSISPKGLVAYSDGKDSRVVMDMASRTFSEVEGFFMYLVPGLECIENALDEARRRWKCKITQYPHWVVSRLIKSDTYCSPGIMKMATLPEWKLADVYALAMRDAGVPFVFTGAKKSDSAWRRRFMSTAYQDAIKNPLAGWHKYDVLSYLRTNGIPEPESSGKSATGIDLSIPSLLWLYDTYPDDFRRLCEVFPFAEAVVWRRTFYGQAA